MYQIKLNKIKLSNFKGIASYERDFTDGLNKISGKNGSGKSSIKNAWEWVLCQNVSDILPTLNNREIPQLDTTVEVEIDVNGMTYHLKRESKGKYITNPETKKLQKTTNKNIYYIDDIEMSQTSYKEKIASILCGGTFEDLTMLTDKEYFNSDTLNWKWSNRRKLLLKMCDIEEEIETLIAKDKYSNIKEYIMKGHQTSDIASTLRKDISALKNEQNRNSILIEQKQSEIREYSSTDFEKVAQELETAKTRLAEIQKSSIAENNASQIAKLQETLLETTTELSRLQTEDTLKLSKLRNEYMKAYNESLDIYDKYNQCKKQLEAVEKEHSDICPMCHQQLPSEMKDKVLKDKQWLSEDANKLSASYKEKKQKCEELKAKIDNFVPHEQIKELETTLSLTKTALEQAKAEDLSNLSAEEEKGLNAKITELTNELAKQQFIEKSKEFILTLQQSSRELGDKIIEIERKENELKDFIQEQTNLITNKVNEKFANGITWSLYNETYKNGEGGIEEDCVCMYNGRRYTSLSTGEKYIANLEVLKVLQNYFGVKLPLMIDNAESTTIPYKTDTQTIEFWVDSNTKLENLIKIQDIYKEI